MRYNAAFALGALLACAPPALSRAQDTPAARHITPPEAQSAPADLAPDASPQEPAAAAHTLEQLRGDLSRLAAAVADLRASLTHSAVDGNVGAADKARAQTSPPSDPLSRLNEAEAELARLTGASEALELRITRAISEANTRIHDLEFRLCEITLGCDVTQLAPLDLNAGLGETGAPIQLAIGEQADFDHAYALLARGDFDAAAQSFDAFIDAYPNSPLMARASLGRGEALFQNGQMRLAARAFLDAFSGAPTGETAPQSLLRLGESLAALGQNSEACVTLSEVIARYPEALAAQHAQASLEEITCEN